MNETRESADIVIVGGGIVGCATAWNLAKKGLKVVVFEKGEIGGRGSGANAGGVRQSGRDLREIPVATMAVNIWGTLDEQLGMDVEYTRKGNLRLCVTEDHVKTMTASVKKQQALGLDVRMVTLEEAQQINPFLSEKVLGCSWCPTDGHANPHRATYAFFRAAKREGVTFYTHEPITDFIVERRSIAAVRSAKRTVLTPLVLNAAGTASRKLANMVGIDFPMYTSYNEVLVTEPRPPMFQTMFGIATGKFYGRQTQHGAFVWAGYTGLEDSLHRDDTTPVYSLNAPCTCRAVLGYFPKLGTLNVIRTWSGIYDKMADGVPVLGPAHEVDGFWLAAGFSGHGFGISPAVGQLMSEWIAEDRPSMDLSAFAYDRFVPQN